MPTEDSFTPDHPLPLFLSRRADEHEQRGSSRLLKASALVITATASAIAIALSLGNPVKVIGDVTASLADMSGLRPRTDQSPPIIQSTQALPPTARGAISRAETAAADQGQTEISEPPSGAVLKQFRAWAAREDAQAQAEPAQPVQNTQAKAEPEQPAQNARAQVLEDDPAPVRHIRKYRRVRTVQNARAEIRHPRARVQRHQNARVEVRPVQDARAQAQPGQNPQPPQPPSFLQSLGWQ